MKISFRSGLNFKNAFLFPIQNTSSRRDLFIGGLWLLVPVIGWLINMGHRVRVVHNVQNGAPPWPAWHNPIDLLKHGFYTFAGMVWYGWPGVGLMTAGGLTGYPLFTVFGFVLWLFAVVAIPGYMSHYCKAYDRSEIFNPLKALKRVVEGGVRYWKAWTIVIPIMLCSFMGLLAFGIGFLWTSVWFWQSAAFCFATVFTQRFELDKSRIGDHS